MSCKGDKGPLVPVVDLDKAAKIGIGIHAYSNSTEGWPSPLNLRRTERTDLDAELLDFVRARPGESVVMVGFGASFSVGSAALTLL